MVRPNWKNQGLHEFLMACADLQTLLTNAVGGTRAIVVDVSNGGDDRGVGSGSILGDMGE